MIRSTWVAIVAIGLVVAGCGGLAGQLKTMKDSANDGNYQSNAAAAVSCSPEQPGCAQLRSIKADACHRLLKQDAPAARRPHVDCAIENYSTGLTALDRVPDKEVDRAQLELGLLDSLQRRREMATGLTDTERDNQAMLELAQRSKAPGASYYGADATLNAALGKGPPGGCAQIAQAAQMLRAAGAAFPGPQARLTQAIANARSARGCAS